MGVVALVGVEVMEVVVVVWGWGREVVEEAVAWMMEAGPLVVEVAGGQGG